MAVNLSMIDQYCQVDVRNARAWLGKRCQSGALKSRNFLVTFFIHVFTRVQLTRVSVCRNEIIEFHISTRMARPVK